jgi:hypothetical protein
MAVPGAGACGVVDGGVGVGGTRARAENCEK